MCSKDIDPDMWRHSSNLISHYVSLINVTRFITKFISYFSMNNSMFILKKQEIIKFVRFARCTNCLSLLGNYEMPHGKSPGYVTPKFHGSVGLCS